MWKSTISITIFNSYVSHYQRVTSMRLKMGHGWAWPNWKFLKNDLNGENEDRHVDLGSNLWDMKNPLRCDVGWSRLCIEESHGSLAWHGSKPWSLCALHVFLVEFEGHMFAIIWDPFLFCRPLAPDIDGSWWFRNKRHAMKKKVRSLL